MTNSAIVQFYDMLYTVGADLSDRQYGRILRFVHDYVHEGVDPDFDEKVFSRAEMKTLLKLITMGKSSEQSPEEDQKPRGRGAPPGNKNAQKTIPETIEINSESNQNNSGINSKTNQFNSENNSESNLHDHSFILNTNDDHDHENNSKTNQFNSESNLHDHETKILKKIEIASQKLGISIEKPELIAKKFLNSGIRSDWLFFQNYNFLDFVVFWLKDHKKYAKKPSEDMRNLFISAVNWDEIRQEYPEWREKQEQKDLKMQKKTIREHYPEHCPNCFATMQVDKCPSCGGFFTFDEATMTHSFNQNLPFTDITHQFLRHLDNKQQQKTAVPGNAVDAACG
jgi:hypothetical protein